MSDSYSSDSQQGNQREGGREGYRGDSGRGGQRGGRPGGREGGGFRIRLSDNEMRSARALQDAFQLRSTVAVLGFAVRTLGQMLEDGQLDELVQQQRSQAPRGGRRDGGGRDGGGGRGRRFNDERPGGGGRGSRPDPFARPSKPQAPEPEPELTPDSEADATADVDTAAVGEAPAQQEPATELPVSEEAVTEQPAVEPKSDEDPKPAEPDSCHAPGFSPAFNPGRTASRQLAEAIPGSTCRTATTPSCAWWISMRSPFHDQPSSLETLEPPQRFISLAGWIRIAVLCSSRARSRPTANCAGC